MSQHSHPPSTSSWHRSVDERLCLIADGLSDYDDTPRNSLPTKDSTPLGQKLPGLGLLLRDYLDPDVTVKSTDFHKRLLCVFRESKYDSAYEKCLERLNADERDRVEKFVADDKPLEEVSDGFDMSVSLGVREHLQDLTGVSGFHVSSSGVQAVRFPAATGANDSESVHLEARSFTPVDVDGLTGDDTLDALHKNGRLHNFIRKLKDMFSGHKKESNVIVYENVPFKNWGMVVDYIPHYTCIPSSVAGVQHIVRFARDHDMSVRCAGFRHSWAPIFGRQGQITISLLSLAEATRIPNFTAMSKALPEWLFRKTELQTLEVVSGTPRVKGNVLVRIGASATNEQLRRWCIENNKYSYPLNVIMVEMTVGGTNAPICHGAGRRHQTLSDLVRKVEYVDCNGKLQTVDDPRLLRAAAGCFGLMGVVTHLTLEFEPMSYALMKPEKIPVLRAVPPPDDMAMDKIPPALRLPNWAPEQRAADIKRFEELATNGFYSEWFWFPYSDLCWVNCWDATADPSGTEDYPSNAQTFFMFISQFTMNVLQNAKILNELVEKLHMDEAAVTLISKAAMFTLPAWDEPVKTYLPDALHFQRGIQNVRVLDVEVEIPLQPSETDPSKPDYAVVRRAWWDAILTCYAHNSKGCPQRMPLEMRIMGGSDIVMAPQKGNKLGTCAIEVLTLEAAKNFWVPYAEEVVGKWLSYCDRGGKKINTRPHWAKQWDGINVDGKPWVEKMKAEDYRLEKEEFKELLAEIGRKHGWSLQDLKRRFSNEFFDAFYFDNI
ncbi:hypothetical protein QC763_401910 [Podospora pseudopauciseta]|uniref:FAD-binding PCMH-type domain-containing protein n=1 Tax=Podospora pseudopauciseta TaxID=2093780 RepID=A0ABR0HBM0_9PEZI|nr:hypothetical protein QC763_401910 [Podospora pseudopauciseta]